jgi:hypothetical protein
VSGQPLWLSCWRCRLTVPCPRPRSVCETTAATSTSITCVTQASVWADASGDDPLALDVQPQASTPGLVAMVACAPNLSDILKVACWSQGANVGGGQPKL